MCRALRVRSSPLIPCPPPPLPAPQPAHQQLIKTNEKTQVLSRLRDQAAGSPGYLKSSARLTAGGHITDYYAIVMQQ